MNRLATLTLPAALACFLLLAGSLGAAELAVGTTVQSVAFLWDAAYPSRQEGEYGQFEVELLQDVEYRMFTSAAEGGTTLDPYLYLLDASGAVVAEDDDSNGSLQPLILFTPTQAGTYRVRLRSYGRGREGRCSLTVAGGDVSGETPVVTPGETHPDLPFGWRPGFATRDLGSYFEYVLETVAGGTYTIEVLSATGGGGDTVLYVMDPEGGIAAFDDDGGAGLLSRASFEATGGGTYRLRLRSYQQMREGRCTVGVSAIEPPVDEPDPDHDHDDHDGHDDHGHPTLLPGDVLLSQPFGWDPAFDVRSDGEYNSYQILMFGNQDYTFETSAAQDGGSDTYLYLVDAEEVIVAADDDGGVGYHSRLTYRSATTQWHHLRLRAYSRGALGTCTLRVSTEAGDPADGIPVLRPGDVLNGVTFEWRSGTSGRSGGAYAEFRVDLEAGTPYAFETSDATGANRDTYLYLVDEEGRVVGADDDGGDTFHSKLLYAADTSGTYFLRLRSYTQGLSGTCTLTSLGNGSVGAALLPDLTPWVMGESLLDAHIQYQNGQKLLRFGYAAANRGAGPLELYGVVNQQSQATDAFQVVYNDNGTRTVFHAGRFVYADHANHNHWHFDEFAAYQLRDAVSDELLRTSSKVSFCLLDAMPYGLEALPNTPTTGRYTCDHQGISVGWVDIYEANIAGQSLNVTGLPDGSYKLVAIVDPAGRLRESDRTNNTAEVQITLRGDSVTVSR